MPQKTTNMKIDQFELIARNSCNHWALARACELKLIKYRENAVFELVSPTGDKFALRIHRPGYHSNEALRSELQWMAMLNKHGLRTPENIATDNGDLFAEVTCEENNTVFQVDMLTWVDGKPLGSIEQGIDLATEALTDTYYKIGSLAGKLHKETEKWDKPSGFYRHSWDVEGTLGENALWGNFADLEFLSEAQRSTLSKASDCLVKILSDFGQDPDRYGLIHCDFLPENLLATEQDLFLIDFDDSGYGWYLFELATSLFFHLGESHFDDVCSSLIDGYRSEREISDEHLELLPVFFLLRGLVYLGWAHTRKETETAIELTPSLVSAVVEMAEQFLTEINDD